MTDRDIDDLLRQYVVDYRRYHLRSSDTLDSLEESRLREQANVAWHTLKALFEDNPDCTEVVLGNPNVDTDEIQRQVFRWKEETVWPARFHNEVTILRAAEVSDCASQIEAFMSPRMWPFIKVVRYVLHVNIADSC
jgi:hypothetical protein